MSRRRSRSRSYYSPNGEHQVDSKSKQLMFQEAEICALGHTVLKDGEQFSDAAAESLITKYLKRKKSQGQVYCLVDRLRFERTSRRRELSYREIKHFYQHKSQSDCFTLFVDDEQTKKRSYESFRCRKEQDVEMLRNIINKASRDPQYLLRDTVPIRQIDASPVYVADSTNRNNHITMVTAPQEYNQRYNAYQDNDRPIVSTRSPSPVYVRSVSRPVIHRSPSPEEIYVYRNSRPLSTEKKYETRQYSRPRSSFYQNSPSPGPSDEITYISSDNRNGPQVTDHGPIYMYASRKSVPDNYSPDLLNYNNRRSIYYR